MKKPDPKLDWQMDDEATWQSAQSATPPEAAPTSQRPKLALLALAAFLLLLLITSSWLWTRPVPNKINQHPPAALQSSTPSDAPAGQSLTQTLEALDNPIHIDTIERAGDYIMAQVTVNYNEEGHPRAYRETRFYAKSAAGWQRSDPDPTLLGPQQSLTVANFTISYRDADADAVYQAVPPLEQLYATLRHDVGLPPSTNVNGPGVAYTIEVTTDLRDTSYYDYPQRRLVIYSPRLLSAPVEIAPATLLEQMSIYPLTHILIHELVYRHDARWQHTFSQWPALENTFALWELWQDNAPLASSRGPVVRWLYANSQVGMTHKRLPDGYDSLCDTFHIWRLTPLDLSIPLTCTDDDMDTSKDSHLSLNSLAPETMLRRTYSQGEARASQDSPFALSVTRETMIDYIVAAYGRDKLPQFLAAFGQNTTLDTLIPALFGLSCSDFEAGWQAYLAQHY